MVQTFIKGMKNKRMAEAIKINKQLSFTETVEAAKKDENIIKSFIEESEPCLFKMNKYDNEIISLRKLVKDLRF